MTDAVETPEVEAPPAPPEPTPVKDKIELLAEKINVSPDTVREWKRIWGKLGSVKVGDRIWVYHALTRSTWIDLQNTVPVKMEDTEITARAKLEESIFKSSLLHPDYKTIPIGSLPAGVVPLVSNNALALSDFNPQEEPEEY